MGLAGGGLTGRIGPPTYFSFTVPVPLWTTLVRRPAATGGATADFSGQVLSGPWNRQWNNNCHRNVPAAQLPTDGSRRRTIRGSTSEAWGEPANPR